MRSQCILGMDIGGTNVRAGLVDKEHNLYHFRIINTQSMRDGVNNKSFVENLTDRIEAYIGAFEDRFEVVGISVGFPSTIDKTRRVVLSTPNIAGLNNVPIADILEKPYTLLLRQGMQQGLLRSPLCQRCTYRQRFD